MLELADLFHDSRIVEVTLSFLLYLPIGLCLVLIRSVVVLLLFLVSSLLPKNNSFNQFLNEAISVILAFSYTADDVAPGGTAKIVVCNRVSLFDAVAIQRFLSNHQCKAVNLWRGNPLTDWLGFRAADLSPSATSCRTREALLEACVNRIQQSDQQLLFLPECEPTSGSHGLLKFELLPFTLAQKLQLPVMPMCLRASRAFQIRPNVFDSHPYSELFWFLFSPSTRFHVNFLPTIFPSISSSDEILCEHARGSICRVMGGEATQFGEQDVIELKKRPDLFHRRHEQRRAEFQQMVNLVHRQVPLAAVEVIRQDLESTKNVERTIANLNARLPPPPRPSPNCNIPKVSSGAGNHRANYERLKQELIEKNRQLFLEKNPN